MVFSSISFLFIFLVAVTGVYFIVPQRFRGARNGVLLIFSLLFYFVGEPKYLILMVVSIISNYLFAIGISTGKRKRLFLVLSCIFNIGVIGVFKYTDFVILNINGIFGTSLPLANIVMPIGISFFTLQGMSYVFDVYLGNVSVQKNVFTVATYIALFPQLVAGPIVRYKTVENELSDRRETLYDVSEGVIRFVYGLSKKMLIANPLGEAATEIFSMPQDERTLPLAWFGAVCYALHIFFDFGGYSDMAIGLGRVFGFRFLENFNYPYISKSITEFWRRWHISLGTWFRDYLYIPLGGNRCKRLRHIFNILVVWALTGLWHGASWNFVIWGTYFGVILLVEKFLLSKLLKKLPAVLSHLYAITLILIGWVIFNSTDVISIIHYVRSMFDFGSISSYRVAFLADRYKLELIAGILLSTPVARLGKRFSGKPIYELLRRVFALALVVMCIAYVTGTSFNPFIYFRF